MMQNFFKKTYLFGLGLAMSTKEKIEDVVDEMVKKGEIEEKDRNITLEELKKKAEKASKDLAEKIEATTKDVFKKFQKDHQEDIDFLKQKIDSLEAKIEELRNRQ